jgi:hypothetical protein
LHLDVLAVPLDLHLDARVGQRCGKYSGPQTDQSCCKAFVGGHGAADPFWPLRGPKSLKTFCARTRIRQYCVPSMSECEGCEGQDCEAKQYHEQQNYSSVISGHPADDERLCFHGRNLRHALSVQHGRRTNRNVNCQTGPMLSVKPIDATHKKTVRTIRVG